MTDLRRFELDELLVRPGTYFNPRTEVLVVVDDSPELDPELFADDGAGEETDWVLVSDETPIDEAERDELLQRFQAEGHASGAHPLDDEDEDLDDTHDADEGA